ncbi:MAG: DUF302 domain-containing protein [Thiobacillus sp.]
MSKIALAVLSATLLISPAYAMENLISVPSTQSTKATLDKLEALAQARGLKVFARIDHAAGAQSIGEKLRPTELIIMGNPKGGTPLLQCAQSYGIDLPLHVLAWEDAAGKSWLTYKDMAKLGHNHPDASCDAALKRLTGALEGLVNEAAK